MSLSLPQRPHPVIEKILKYIVIGTSILFIVFVLMSIFRVGLISWFYNSIFDWVSAKLGFDYYLAQFIALSMTAIFSATYPYLCWTFFTGRYQLHTTVVLIAASGVMCLMVYTVGSDVYFDRQTGQPLKWFADTPDGRAWSNSPGYDKKFGIKLRPFTPEIAQGEADARKKAVEDSQRKAENIRQRQEAEREAQEKAVTEQKQAQAEQEALRQRAAEEKAAAQEKAVTEKAARQNQSANLPPQITPPPPPDRYIMRASTNNQYLPPGTIIQVFLFDDNGIQHEASIVNATYNNYQLEIQLSEPITSKGGRVNWYIPPPRSMMSMPPLPTIEIPGMPTTRFKLR